MILLYDLTPVLCLMEWLAGNLEFMCASHEFILQVTIKLISLLNLVNFMEYVIDCRNLNEICDY
jgi:hypothetical protein